MVCGKIVHDSYICENEARVMENIIVEKVWLTDTEVWIRTTDFREACERFADYQRLKFTTPKQRENFQVGDFGIRWEELDEDLSFEGFFLEKKSNPLYDLFIAHPELNAAAIARRLGMSQSLFAHTDEVPVNGYRFSNPITQDYTT